MKNLFFIAFLALTSCNTVSIDAMYGKRTFDDRTEWQDQNKDEVVGLTFESAGKNGFGIETGFSSEQNLYQDPIYLNRKVNGVDTKIQELFFGIRKSFMVTDSLQLFLSGGLSAFRVQVDVDLQYAGKPQAGDLSYAPYVQAGTNWYITNQLRAGLLYRHHFMNENANIFITRPDLDADLVAVTLGWSF